MIRTLVVAVSLLAVPPAHAGPGHDHRPPKATGPTVVLAALVKPYLKVRQALVKDDLPEARKWAGMLMRAARAHHLPELTKAAFAFKDADLPAARLAFRDVSAILIAAIEAYPPARAAMKVYDCPQAPGRWLQIGSMPTNPYQGGDLRKCGVEIPASAAIQKAAAAAAASEAGGGHDHEGPGHEGRDHEGRDH